MLMFIFLHIAIKMIHLNKLQQHNKKNYFFFKRKELIYDYNLIKFKKISSCFNYILIYKILPYFISIMCLFKCYQKKYVTNTQSFENCMRYFQMTRYRFIKLITNISNLVPNFINDEYIYWEYMSNTMFNMERSFFFTELFLATSCLYSIIVLVLVTSSVYGLMIQKTLSECFAITLFMACYLIFNDDILNYQYSFSTNLLSNILPIVKVFPQPSVVTTPMDQTHFGQEPIPQPKAFIYMFNSSIILDNLGQATKITICMSSGFYLLIVSNYLKWYRLTSFEYLIIIMFAVIGHVLLCSANDLLIAYLSIELFSLSAYILSSFKKFSSYSVDSGLKYFITGATSSSFFLLGSSFLYGESGGIAFNFFEIFFNRADFLHPALTQWPQKEDDYEEFKDWCPEDNFDEISLIYMPTELSPTFGPTEIMDHLGLGSKFYSRIKNQHWRFFNHDTFFLELFYAYNVVESFYGKINSEVIEDFLWTQYSESNCWWKLSLLDSFKFFVEELMTIYDNVSYVNSIKRQRDSVYYYKHPEAFAFVWNWYLFQPEHYGLKDLSLALIFFSLFIKLGLAPFHLWSLDVYEGSPTPSSFFFSIIGKISIYVILYRISHLSFNYTIADISYLTFMTSILSIFVGSFGGLKTKKIKTMLAYSSINQMGYSLLTFNSSYSLIALEAFLFYMLLYIFSGLASWCILIFLVLKTKTKKNKYNIELCDLTLLSNTNPALASAFSLTLFSIAGLPPLVGFLAKFSVLQVFLKTFFFEFLLDSNSTTHLDSLNILRNMPGIVEPLKLGTKLTHLNFFYTYNYIFIVLSVLIIFCSVVSIFYYVRVVKVMYFENFFIGRLYYPLENKETLILSVLVFLTVFFFVNPNLLYLVVHSVALLTCSKAKSANNFIYYSSDQPILNVILNFYSSGQSIFLRLQHYYIIIKKRIILF